MLNRNTPEQGMPIQQYLAEKYGPAMASQFGRPGNPLDIAGRMVDISFNSSRNIFPTVECHAFMEYFYKQSMDGGKTLTRSAKGAIAHRILYQPKTFRHVSLLYLLLLSIILYLLFLQKFFIGNYAIK